MTDAIVVGGGVIGLSIAYELAGVGLSVQVVEQGQLGREASWAAAGILPPGNLAQAKDPESQLRAHSYRLWPQLSRHLKDETGIDNGFRPSGGVEVCQHTEPTQFHDDMLRWKQEGVAVEELSPDVISQLEPALNPEIRSGYFLPELCQVRSPWHLDALKTGCANRGVEFEIGSPVVGFETKGDRLLRVRTATARYAADFVCIAGGAWSKPLLADLDLQLPVEPVRGQIVLLAARPALIRHVVEDGRRYLVPRDDGRILVGSTMERVGFDKRNTAGGIGELMRFATRLVPALAEASYEQAWSGLRPGSIDGLPYLDRVPTMENAFVAAGHFRAGMQISPITAVLMRELMLGQTPTVSLESFRCDRNSNELPVIAN